MDQPCSSKLPRITCTNSAIGGFYNFADNANLTINNMNVGHLKQSTSQEALLGIEFQVADPIDTFCGREQTFLEVKNAFDQQEGKHPYNLVAVCGYGGMGKTQFARMYIKRNREELQNIVWIFAETEGTINDSFNQLRKKLTDKGYPCYSHQDVYEYLNSDLTIFVFDNSKDIRSIQLFLPTKYNKSLFLVTSKSKNWDVFHSIELKLLDLTDAEDIMKAVLVKKHKILIEDTQLKGIVKKLELETIPLLLQIRAGYICHVVLFLRNIGKQYNFEDIVQELNIQHDLVIQKFHNFIMDPYDKSMFATIYQTLEQIRNAEDDASKTADKMLGIAAYLNPDRIYEDIFTYLLDIENTNTLNYSLYILYQFSLLQISGSIIQIHRTVQQCVQYYHREIIKTSEYYELTLPALLRYCYMDHDEIIFKHGEKYFELLRTFYERNKCNLFHRKLIDAAPPTTLQLMLNQSEVIRNPDFVCQTVVRSRDVIKQILRDSDIDFNAKDDKGCNALFYLDFDDDVNICSLELAINLMYNTMKKLIENGADVNSQNVEGNMIIHYLCNLANRYTRDKNMFKRCALIIQLGANPGIKNHAGQTAADLAQEHGLTLTFQLLNAVISGYRYISHIAAKHQQFNCLKWLISHEVCHMNDRDDTGCTILHILAGLPQLDEEHEKTLFYKTAFLLKYNCDVSIVNNAGEMASGVARRCGREMIADLLDAWVQPGRIIYETAAHRSKVERFSFVRNEDGEHVNEQDDTGCTLLHALCDLEIHGDTELELDIVKLVAHLTIRYEAYLYIKNKANETPADVARRRGHHQLADLLECNMDEILEGVALKYKQWREQISYVPFI